VIIVADTLLTVTGGSSYTVATPTAITDVYYSKALTPVEFPQYFAWTPSLNTGNADLSAYTAARFNLIGRLCTVKFYAENVSLTGTAGTIKVGLPIVSAVSEFISRLAASVYIPTTTVAVRCDVLANAVTMEIYKDLNNGNWVANEAGLYFYINGQYEI
jgi:hypothetical protein